MSSEMSGEMSGGMSDETLAVTEDVGCVGSNDTSFQLKQMRSVRQEKRVNQLRSTLFFVFTYP